MKYVVFFTLMLMGVLTSSTEGCNPEGHSTNHKSDDSHEIEHEDVTKTIEPSTTLETAHVEPTMTAKPSISEAVHSTVKPIIIVAENMNKTAPAVVMNEMGASTLTIATSMKPDVDLQNKTENSAEIISEDANDTSVTTPIEMTTVAEMVTSTWTIVTSMEPDVVSLNKTEQPPTIINEEVNKTSIPVLVEMTTVAALVNFTEKPDKTAPDMTATTAANIHMETSTHTSEDMNINKTAAAVMASSSMPMIITSPTVIRRERRQAIVTMKTPAVPNTPVFGGRFSTRTPMQVTRKARHDTTVGPETAGSRTTM